uniref:Uncharacterized protein n=1 Tax=Knipowitschia caucasica TaxID=637954 RepID=A0AAV2MBX4_KNICA
MSERGVLSRSVFDKGHGQLHLCCRRDTPVHGRSLCLWISKPIRFNLVPVTPFSSWSLHSTLDSSDVSLLPAFNCQLSKC